MITIEQKQSIAAVIARMGGLSIGVGTKERACSIAAINLALDGRLTDEIPACMSLVIGKWIIIVQDAMPEAMRNSPEWLSLLPIAAGTGRDHEAERATIILDWMWGTVLPSLQPQADAGGYGAEWRTMCEQRTEKSALAAEEAAALAAEAARTLKASAAAWGAARAAARAAEAEAAALAAEEAAAWAAELAAAAEWAAEAAAAARAAEAAAWESFAPADLLARLIAVTDELAERKGAGNE